MKLDLNNSFLDQYNDDDRKWSELVVGTTSFETPNGRRIIKKKKDKIGNEEKENRQNDSRKWFQILSSSRQGDDRWEWVIELEKGIVDATNIRKK